MKGLCHISESNHCIPCISIEHNRGQLLLNVCLIVDFFFFAHNIQNNGGGGKFKIANSFNG